MRWALSLAAATVMLTWGAAGASDFDYTVSTESPVPAAFEAVRDSVRAEGFQIPAVHTLPVPADYVVVEVCAPDEVRKLYDADPKLGLFCPCGKIGVYEDLQSPGKTRISLLLPSALAKMHPAPEVQEMARRLEPRLKRVVDRAREDLALARRDELDAL